MQCKFLNLSTFNHISKICACRGGLWTNFIQRKKWSMVGWEVGIGGSTNFFFFLLLFKAAPIAYGSNRARGQIQAAAASLHHNHSNARSELHLWPYTAACDKTGSLIHWARPGIEPASSWVLVRFLTYWAKMGTPGSSNPWMTVCPYLWI